ncbi:hypothetical protein EON83_15735 [bacterium]|nr:MAG: hypothetical protein EON83_15735 [bacterium]
MLWAKVLGQFGPLQPKTERLCLREWFKSYPVLGMGKLHPPSYHEQLEARLELREWAQAHVPSEVFDEMERFGF